MSHAHVFDVIRQQFVERALVLLNGNPALSTGICVFRLPAPSPSPGSRPQFVFDGPSPNLYLAAAALNLYLPALAD